MCQHEIVKNNVNAISGSFMWHLHEYNRFNIGAFNELCKAVEILTVKDKGNAHIASEISFIYAQTLRHIIYHFDSGDGCRINDLPESYWEYIDRLDYTVVKYLNPEV